MHMRRLNNSSDQTEDGKLVNGAIYVHVYIAAYNLYNIHTELR